MISLKPDAPAEQRAGRRLWRSAAERAADKAEARARTARSAIDEQRFRDQLELERLEALREHTKVRDELAQHAKAQQDEAARQRRSWTQRISRTVVLASANVGVNGVAVLGQVLALTLGPLGLDWWAAIPIALVVESVAVNIGYIAHDKLVNGHSAGWLRLSSYAMGFGVGWFNYDHNISPDANNVVPATAPYAVMFGAASLLSPVLWQIYSRWKHWERLRTQGLLEARAPKFSKLRWLIPSLRAETWQAFKQGIAEGIESPEVALAEVRARTHAGTAQDTLRQADKELAATYSAFLTLTLTHMAAIYHDLDGEDPKATEARNDINRFVSRFRPFFPPLDSSPDPSATPTERGTDEEPPEERKLPTEQDNRKAKTRVVRAIKAGKPVPTKSEVASWFEFSDSWGYDRVCDAKDALIAEGWRFPAKGDPVPPAGSLNGSPTS